MREEHPNQPELPTFAPGGPVPPQASAQVVEMSEVAALQVKVMELGLVREGRPVFVYDAKLAKQKSGNAERQERHRQKLKESGLVVMPVPAAIASAVKDAGGNWADLVAKLGEAPSTPAPLGVVPQTPTSGIGGDEVIPKAARAEIIEAGGLDQWVQKRVDSAIAALPPAPTVAPKIIEKVVEKPVVRLTSEQKKIYELGKKAAQLSGWRASVLRWVLS